jgi:hypothetical protein
MPSTPPLPPDVVTRADAAEILCVGPKRVTNMRWQGQLEPVTTPHRKIGVFDRAQVEALAASARRLEPEQRHAEQETSRFASPPDQEATSAELKAAAEWTRDNPGPFVGTDGAAEILGVTPQYVGRLAGQGRLPWLPTGRSGGAPTRVYRRARREVIARARATRPSVRVRGG